MALDWSSSYGCSTSSWPPGRICVGNHDEALSYDGSRFASSVSPGDFAEFLNANIAHEWIERAGKLAVRFFNKRLTLFLPDGLLIAHAGFPLTDLHAQLEQSGNWNDPLPLRLHLDAGPPDRAQEDAKPVYARKPVRARGFRCILRASVRGWVGRSLTVRGHDHSEESLHHLPCLHDAPHAAPTVAAAPAARVFRSL